MEAFLKQLANSVTKENLPYLYRHCYIFPTKRASKYFTDFLKEKFVDHNFILPKTITIQDFILENTSYNVVDDWLLLLELYQIQTSITQVLQPLEYFLPWGKMILKDFDECDKYLVDVDKLFNLLKSQKEMDDSFMLSEETRKFIEQFIFTNSTIQDTKSSKYKHEFLKTWTLLGDIHKQFSQSLKQRNCAYEGMAYREVYEHLAAKKIRLTYDKIVFAGFNALSVCEEKIFKIIERDYQAEFWWDADEHFLKNKLHEAGNFLRIYQQLFYGKNHHWIIDSFLKKNKTIDIVGVSSTVAQAGYVSHQLSNLHLEGNTAVVLCDEQLLVPLLYYTNTENVNITMGYSLTNSEQYLFLDVILKYFCNAKNLENSIEFYVKDVEALLQHSYGSQLINNKQQLENMLPYFMPYIPDDVLSSFFPDLLLKRNNSAYDIVEHVILIFQFMPTIQSFFLPAKEILIQQLQQLLLLLKEHPIKMEQSALPYIVKQFLSNTKIPFIPSAKEQAQPIQIMGFLESRNLDFDNLFILSLNDDHLPGTNKTNSFIPYNLRKGFGLPTFEQFDGINAYHFYRLLKRARNIQLIYNNQIAENVSEKSRFIRQIVHDLSTQENTVREYIAVPNDATESHATDTSLVTVFKTTEMIEALRKQIFSASSLKTYIHCPIQFHLKYIAKINEPETLAEDIDAAVFGQILHKILELIYTPYINTSLTKEKFNLIVEDDFIHGTTKIACEKLKLPKEIMYGSNRLQLTIIEKIVKKILLNDALLAPLTVAKTEGTLLWSNLKLEDGSLVSIKGTIDRIDKITDHAVKIVDYKTGAIKFPPFPDCHNDADVVDFLDALFVFEKEDYSACFQGLLYALLYYKLYDCREIYVGFHQAKKMKEGIVYLNNQQPIPIGLLLDFEKRLAALISDIVYKQTHFIQSGNQNSYQYSAYADLLGLDV